MRKAPKFWFKDKGLISTLLWPISALYAFGAMIDQSQKAVDPKASDAFVICVGNIVVGGAGKTPVVDYIAAKLDSQDITSAIVSRGYGGTQSDPIMVDAMRHTAQEVGDEPFMLAQKGHMVWVGDKRGKTIEQAESMARVVMTDDGLQDPSIVRDMVIAVFDGGVGIGNGLTLPAGPLRTKLSDMAADGIVIIGADKTGLTAKLPQDIEVFTAEMSLDQKGVSKLSGKKCCVFAGIGRPEKFFDSCEMAGLTVSQSYAFPDHHAYVDQDVHRLMAFKEDGLTLVTTEKDYARLPTKLKPHVTALPAKLVFSDNGFDEWLRRHVEAAL